MKSALPVLLLFVLPVRLCADDKMTDVERIKITQQISGEFVVTKVRIPLAEKHYKLIPPKPSKDGDAIQVISAQKRFIEPNTKVQITLVHVEDNTIILDINGGGKEKRHWRDHVQVGIGGRGVGEQNPIQRAQQPVGTTLVLEFRGNPTGDDIKKWLAPWFQFSARSATVDWVTTLPPSFQAGIKGRYAVEGMTPEIVETAIGKPDKRIRENDDYNQNETWIYGYPPGPCTFIVFEKNVVTRIKKY